VAALASWLDARSHDGTWLVRIEDVDIPRCVPGAADEILRQLVACGLAPDAPPVYQSQRTHLYQTAFDTLIAQGLAYPCACSRKDIEAALAALGEPKPRDGELVYPGTCRSGLQGKAARAWRFLTRIYPSNIPIVLVAWTYSAINKEALSDPLSAGLTHWHDRRLGAQQQNVEAQVGDFVLKRADGLWAYQLAVVVDDAAQGITHVVRGKDLADNTARQILLQRALGYATPQYLHTPLVLAADGHKLSKQNGAMPLDLAQPLVALNAAAKVLGLPSSTGSVQQALQAWTRAWLLQS
jgi:glutamyl-Q tRNA(Asp) synthetase